MSNGSERTPWDLSPAVVERAHAGYGLPQFCTLCDHPIRGSAERLAPDSASGARPDAWRHPQDRHGHCITDPDEATQ
ncbi:hypothetical protein [Streptomyces sp. NPDC006879]|uniref:hypothetical protein n=1 Tax=Streptomyces sp. NPDC006879 TaxID=3364767 RepID=UPI0036B8D0F6